jgi:tetratricopeptide (TPR) repeat protein
VNSPLRVIWILVIVLGCSPFKREFKKANDLLAEKKTAEALIHIDRAIALAKDNESKVLSYRLAARITHIETKEFQKAIAYYRRLVLESNDRSEQATSQKMISEISFENLNDYPQSIIEISKFLDLPESKAEANRYRLMLARAYYYTNNRVQALVEVENALKTTMDDELKFQYLVLKGNIFSGQKDLKSATAAFREVVRAFPEKSVKDNVAVILSANLEEMFEFDEAIKVLEDLRPHYSNPEYVNLKIERLKMRKKNQPGARWKKK